MHMDSKILQTPVSTAGQTLKVRKTTRKGGGGLNCVFQNFFFYVQELFLGSESERGSESD